MHACIRRMHACMPPVAVVVLSSRHRPALGDAEDSIVNVLGIMCEHVAEAASKTDEIQALMFTATVCVVQVQSV
jgi:hypothetical protein